MCNSSQLILSSVKEQKSSSCTSIPTDKVNTNIPVISPIQNNEEISSVSIQTLSNEIQFNYYYLPTDKNYDLKNDQINEKRCFKT